MKMIEKIIVVVHDEYNLSLITKYKNSTLEIKSIEMDKLFSMIGTIKKNKTPITLFFTNNNDQQQIYWTEELPVISYLNLQMLLAKRAENKTGNHDLQETIRIDPNKQKYLFFAANIETFWKNFIKITSNQFNGIAFLALEAQKIVKHFSKSINGLNAHKEKRLQVLMFYDRKNAIQCIIFEDYIIQQTNFVPISGFSDKIIEGYFIQHLKDMHEQYKQYKKDAYLIISNEIKKSLTEYEDSTYENIVLLTPYEVSIVNGTDQIVEKKSKYADLCFVSSLLDGSSSFMFNTLTQKTALNKKKQHLYLNLSSSFLMLFLFISSAFFYFMISDDEQIYQKLLKTEERLQSEFKETKEILLNHDSKNKEKILIYKFLQSNDTSPREQIYNLKQNLKIKSLNWNSAEIHSASSNMSIKVVGELILAKNETERRIISSFNDYHLTSIYNEENNEIEIVLTHK